MRLLETGKQLEHVEGHCRRAQPPPGTLVTSNYHCHNIGHSHREKAQVNAQIFKKLPTIIADYLRAGLFFGTDNDLISPRVERSVCVRVENIGVAFHYLYNVISFHRIALGKSVFAEV